ncbi:MAG: 4-hydroxy-3-methylbut-2-enyl diphosphate reductase [Planctomycetota bacterium]|nr:MAG: 4-hydroxy-3-methylbut-2-enyl diphosphate reductase [Planctomycetota bacterium]
MKVIIAKKSGFCLGVKGAIELARKTVRENKAGKVVALGPLIHNRQVVEELEKVGLNQAGNLEDLETNTTLLIRSHGAPPETFARAKQLGLNIVDATCVLVRRAQKIVKQLHEEGYQVVMIGDGEHPEVKGVIGYAPNVIVVDRKEELEEALPQKGKIGIVAQTTHAPEHVGAMIAAITSRPFDEVKVVNTLCMEVVRRQKAALELCEHVDVMFVLGGLHSANTQALAKICMEKGIPTYHLECWNQFKPEMANGHQCAGITAGASTPDYIINEFAENLKTYQTILQT